jgi:hypothetical protein
MLPFDEAKAILGDIAASAGNVILVGGQAIEFWRQYYNIASNLDYLTRDIDLYADSLSADSNFQAFAHKDHAEIHLPDMDDASPNMESKISNLAAHPIKQNKEGVEQARLSVEIAKAYLGELIDQSKIKDTFGMIKRISRFSNREPSLLAFYSYGIDTLNAIPVDRYADEEQFKTLRYPQIRVEINGKREKFKALMASYTI